MNEGDGAQQTAQLKETWESVQLLNVLIILSASMLIESQEVKTFLDLHNKKSFAALSQTTEVAAHWG